MDVRLRYLLCPGSFNIALHRRQQCATFAALILSLMGVLDPGSNCVHSRMLSACTPDEVFLLGPYLQKHLSELSDTFNQANIFVR